MEPPSAEAQTCFRLSATTVRLEDELGIERGGPVHRDIDDRKGEFSVWLNGKNLCYFLRTDGGYVTLSVCDLDRGDAHKIAVAGDTMPGHVALQNLIIAIESDGGTGPQRARQIAEILLDGSPHAFTSFRRSLT